MTPKEKAEELIEVLKKRQDTEAFYVHKGNDLVWNYYYDVSGFIKDSYFHFTSKKNKIDNVDIFNIEETTDQLAKIELKKLIKKIGL